MKFLKLVCVVSLLCSANGSADQPENNQNQNHLNLTDEPLLRLEWEYEEEQRQLELELARHRLSLHDSRADPYAIMAAMERWMETREDRLIAQWNRAKQLDEALPLLRTDHSMENPEDDEAEEVNPELTELREQVEHAFEAAYAGVTPEEGQARYDRWLHENRGLLEHLSQIEREEGERIWYEQGPEPIIIEVPDHPSAEELKAADLREAIAREYLRLRVEGKGLSPAEFQMDYDRNCQRIEAWEAQLQALSPVLVRQALLREIDRLEAAFAPWETLPLPEEPEQDARDRKL